MIFEQLNPLDKDKKMIRALTDQKLEEQIILFRAAMSNANLGFWNRKNELEAYAKNKASDTGHFESEDPQLLFAHSDASGFGYGYELLIEEKTRRDQLKK